MPAGAYDVDAEGSVWVRGREGVTQEAQGSGGPRQRLPGPPLTCRGYSDRVIPQLPPWFDPDAQESWLEERLQAAEASDWTLRCPWCDLHLPGDAPSRCERCAGALPTGGAPPGPAPRALPAVSWALRTRQALVPAAAVALLTSALIGAGALSPLAAWLAWPLAALIATFGALRIRAARSLLRRRLLARGVPAAGEITCVAPNHGRAWDGRAPWQVSYSFRVGERLGRGLFVTWNTVDSIRAVGSPIWILYDPEDIADSSPWPPPTGWPFART